MVAAAPAQLEERLVNCKAVDVVVKVLKLAPSASKYCSSVLKISTVQTTRTVSITETASATTTTVTTVTSTGGEGGTVTITAAPTTETTTSTTTTTTTTFSSSCPAANKRDVQERAAAVTSIPAGACPSAPIKGFACSIVYSACGCLGLPTPTRTATAAFTASITNTATATSTSTVFVSNPPPSTFLFQQTNLYYAHTF
ncbi:hypothetical protein SVAN01_08884 [Stagonosporopsis vannaccii]|nr:hypothetical protein SVAN01_08884 [Stagonosporopsis vannaccii]